MQGWRFIRNGGRLILEQSLFPDLLFDRPAPFVLRVTINNPDKMNALTPKIHKQLENVWAAIDRDPETRCSIITGAGRAFCAGGATDAMAGDQDLDAGQWMARDFNSATNMVNSLINSRKPIVSAING